MDAVSKAARLVDVRPRLVRTLQDSHAGEKAAGYAYRGHWKSLPAGTAARDRIRVIEAEEWHHRDVVAGWLATLGEAPRPWRERAMGAIGRVFGAVCFVPGRFFPMYFAGRLEAQNVGEYVRAAEAARALGLDDCATDMDTMTRVEQAHEDFFADEVRGHWLLAPTRRLFGWSPGMMQAMSIYEHPINTLAGEPSSLAEHEGRALLVVNVASKCGLTPQYTGLEELQQTYGERGFTVLGFPCNQFGGQEPGSAEDIATFCSTTYGVSFPLFEKIDVNGPDRHPIYDELTTVADADGHDGDIRWNFEKFLVAPDGSITRFSPMVAPAAPELVEAIEGALPA
jgi:glutathione peroxidase